MRILRALKTVVSASALSLIGLSMLASAANAQTVEYCVKGEDGKLPPACEYTPLTTVPGAFESGQKTNPIKAITNIYGVAIGLAAILAVGMIIWAGVEYATTEAIFQKSSAKEKWQGALWGLLLLLASYLILRTINADLVNINLDLGEPRAGAVSVATDPLNDIKKAVQQSANAYQETIKASSEKVATAQTTIADLKTQKKNLEADLDSYYDDAGNSVNLTDAQKAKRDEIIKKLEEIDASIKTQEKAIVDAKVSAAQAGSDVVRKNIDLATASGLQRGLSDPKEAAYAISNIQNLKNSAWTKMNEYSGAYQEATGAARSANPIDAQKILVNSSADQAIALIRAANSLGDANQTINSQAALNSAAATIVSANSLLVSMTADPKAITELTKITTSNMQKLREIGARKLSCPVNNVSIVGGRVVCER